MRMPHTHYTKGKTVWLRLKSGAEHVGRFVERKGRFVVLDCGKFTTKDLAAMSFRRHKT
jgi:hypothetical protein